jgi:deoxyribodipyrimidine photo-lyase
MKQQFKRSLFIFRRDLRVHDNTGLLEALRSSESVIPCFIFDKRQIGEDNTYRSMNSIQFMLESLKDLEKQLEAREGLLYYFYGIAEDVVEDLLKTHEIDAVFTSEDYTPFAVKRDAAIEKVCIRLGRQFISTADSMLNAPGSVLKDNGQPYTVYTPYYKRSMLVEVPRPVVVTHHNFFTGKVASHHAKLPTDIFAYDNKELLVHGGSEAASKIVHHLTGFKDYATDRDIPSMPTTHLSAYNKFGCISVRDLYHRLSSALGAQHGLVRQLYWRDFFTQIAGLFPHVFHGAFHQEYDRLVWNNDHKAFDRWCNGTTGFPIVDAGMRELNTTGYMHNRTRMIVASFLTKDLHISWRWGERYFAQQLVDYDPSVNNGSWQWSASTGCDAQPYFRIFNPWLQQQKFDPACTYIKQWVPELRRFSAEIIHKWDKVGSTIGGSYPTPMIDHSKESERAKLLFKAAKGYAL